VPSNHRVIGLAAVLTVLAAGCGGRTPEPAPAASKPGPRVFHIKPGPDVQDATQTALIEAKPGDTVEFDEGTFEFTAGLSLAVANVTVRGQGMGKTILSFKNQDAGKEGLLVKQGGILLEGLSVQDTKGDAVKVNEADGVTLRQVRAEWTGGPKTTNGGYGLYPVQCKNVLIERCEVSGASDAGIYVGQSHNVVVRRCRAEKNVAGIEIENCTDAEAYGNEATDNAGGLLVFDLPGLPAKNGKRVRVHDNRLVANNHANFAPAGNMVADVAPGTGLMILATDEVEVFNNTITANQTYGLAIVSFIVTGRPIQDKDYDPYPEAVYVHDNAFEANGRRPAGLQGLLLGKLLGTPLPDVVYDGILNPGKLVDGKMPADRRVYLKNNGQATWVNLHWDRLNVKDVQGSRGRVEHNPKELEGELRPLPPVVLPGVQ
jgi:parallel beta-helix repeat protein